ncbi:c-type cytochrome [Sulfurimonas sp. C5]|uniref:c-type cytochrome n=1 Tax=Sulfurimonas sp. C5 TaxID=3036947 RepID=UPI0024586B93|nr:c-type cytochrome [Sulfurimonas sp. C5]MDH4943856.1 cytochrome c [Sulfurimonas sp. C5]
MKYILFLILANSLFCESTFITPMEYASSLYKNPRGIGCQKCHGENGEGLLIAKYIHKGKEKEFIGPQINNISFEKFANELSKRKRGMPRYFLTDSEVQALYRYLHRNDKKSEKKN